MKTKRILTNVALALTLGLFYTACNKAKDPITLDTDTSSATDNSTADNSFSDIFKSVNEVADTSSDLKSLGCPIITKTSVAGGFPKTLTIDYQALCGDKSGKITAVLSDHWKNAGAVLTVTTQDYHDGVNKVDAGTFTITNNGKNAAGNVSFTIDVKGASIVTPSGTISWSTTRTIEQIAGADTPLIRIDDVFSITGSASGTSAKGVAFTANIDKALIVAANCKYIESGVISLTPSGKKTRTIDFGSSGCDNDAKVTIDGKTIDVKM